MSHNPAILTAAELSHTPQQIRVPQARSRIDMTLQGTPKMPRMASTTPGIVHSVKCSQLYRRSHPPMECVLRANQETPYLAAFDAVAVLHAEVERVLGRGLLELDVKFQDRGQYGPDWFTSGDQFLVRAFAQLCAGAHQRLMTVF